METSRNCQGGKADPDRHESRRASRRQTTEKCDFSFHLHLDRGSVMESFTLAFVARKENVLFLGPLGVGSTHLAGYQGLSPWLQDLFHNYGYPDQKTQKGDRPAENLFQLQPGCGRRGRLSSGHHPRRLSILPVLSHRYERSSIIITSNKGFGDWRELFGDQVIGSFIMSR